MTPYELRYQVVQMATGILMRHWERETDLAVAKNADVPNAPSKESIRSYAEHLYEFIAPEGLVWPKRKKSAAEAPPEPLLE